MKRRRVGEGEEKEMRRRTAGEEVTRQKREGVEEKRRWRVGEEGEGEEMRQRLVGEGEEKETQQRRVGEEEEKETRQSRVGEGEMWRSKVGEEAPLWQWEVAAEMQTEILLTPGMRQAGTLGPLGLGRWPVQRPGLSRLLGPGPEPELGPAPARGTGELWLGYREKSHRTDGGSPEFIHAPTWPTEPQPPDATA